MVIEINTLINLQIHIYIYIYIITHITYYSLIVTSHLLIITHNYSDYSYVCIYIYI